MLTLFLTAGLAVAQTEGPGPQVALSHTFGDGTLIHQDGRSLRHPAASTQTAIGPTAIVEHGFVFADEGKHPREGALTWCALGEPWTCEPIVTTGQPAWPKLTPDGRRLTYFAASNGVMALFVYERVTGHTTQLTNHSPVARLGQPPESHVPSPAHGDYRVDDNSVYWGDTTVSLP